jgi:methyl-accepting chemotaxis protein
MTIIIACLTILVIAVLSSVLLIRANGTTARLSYRSLQNLLDANALSVQQDLSQYMAAIHTLANVFNRFDTFEEGRRRAYLNESVRSLLESSPEFIGIYMAWKPGLIDQDPEPYNPVYSQEQGGRIIQSELSAWNRAEYERCQEALRSGQIDWRISDPMPLVNQGRTMTAALMTVPIIADQNRALYGYVGAVVDLSFIQNLIAGIKPLDAGYGALYADTGTIVAHQDPSRAGSKFQDTAAKILGPAGVQAVNQSLADGQYRRFEDDDDVFAIRPFYIGKMNKPWAVFATVPIAAVLEPVREMIRFTVILALVMVIIASGTAFLVISLSINPVTQVTLTLKDISEGEGDLTKTIKAAGNDEISDLARYFNQTLEKIRRLIITIKNHTGTLSAIGGDLAANMTETAAAINEIAANIHNINSRVINQSAGITETNATMEQITLNIEKLNKEVERQTSSVSQSSSAIEEMLANIQSVTQTLIKNTGNMQELMEASEVGKGGLQEVAADIQEIARESEGLLEINAVMENIASQTNLLSMNAAIEAAHAGEAGKGFAVVADEIRKLAENSGEQSKTISAVLKKIKDSIDKIIKSTNDVLNKFEAIDGGVKTVAEQEAHVLTAMEEQGAGSHQILDALGLLSDVTQRVKSGSVQMLEGSKEVIQESKQLELGAHEIAGGMNEMAAGASQINTAVIQVNDISGKNKDHIEILVKELSRFKV